MPRPDPKQFFEMLEDSMGGLRRIYVLREALRLRLFDYLERPMTSRDMARRFDLDADMADLFCEALTAMGLLESDAHGDYRNSGMASTYLLRGSQYMQDRSLRWIWTGLDRWQDLGRYLRSGPDLIESSEFFNDDWIRGIAERAICGDVQEIANVIADMIDMSGGKRLLDLGGGHGLYSIAFCAKVPDLHAVVFDLPEMVPNTRGYIEEHGATSVEVSAGDFTRDDIGNGYDLVFSSYNSSGSDVAMVPKVSSALRPGGHLVLRQFTEKAKCEPLAGLEWNFVAFRGAKRGRKRFSGPDSCSLEAYGEALEEQGFEILRHWPFDSMSEMMVARKAGE